MCTCNPAIRTPFCGRIGCEWPNQLKPAMQSVLHWRDIQHDRPRNGQKIKARNAKHIEWYVVFNEPAQFNLAFWREVNDFEAEKYFETQQVTTVNAYELQHDDRRVFHADPAPDEINRASSQFDVPLPTIDSIIACPAPFEMFGEKEPKAAPHDLFNFFFDGAYITIKNKKQSNDLSLALDRAMGTWESPPYWLVKLSDKLKGLELGQCQSHGEHNG